MKKILIFIITIILIAFMLFNLLKVKEAEYIFKGKFSFDITDSTMFANTYLEPVSFGFLIGDLDVQGMTIKNTDSLDKSEDYIISFRHPLEAVYLNSSLVKGEGQVHLKKQAVEIVQNKLITENYLFIYLLKPKGKYRLLLP